MLGKVFQLDTASLRTKRDLFLPRICPTFTFATVSDGTYSREFPTLKSVFKDQPKQWNLFGPNNAIREPLYRTTVLSNEKTRNRLPVPGAGNHIVMYCGGGGFMANLQLIQERFLSQWSKGANTPIFELHYSLSPEHQFPEQLNELLNLYLGIVEYYGQVEGVTDLKVILMGDSAGGNMILGLTNLLAQLSLPMPAMLVTIYPPVDLSVDRFSPSLLRSFEDRLLYFSYLRVCRDSYVGQTLQVAGNWLLSPICAPDSLLKRYPPWHMYCGELDPMYDDCLKMAHRVNQLTGTTSFYSLEGLKHGFLGFDLPMRMGVTEVRVFHQQILSLLKSTVAQACS